MKALRALPLLLVLVGLAPSARAASVSYLSEFSGSGFDAIGVTPFDPALGTLDSVQVSIDGRLTVSGVAPQQTIPQTLGPPIPVAYTYQVSVGQDFFGLLGKYFDFSGNAQFRFSGATPADVARPFAFVTDFSYDFSFTFITDFSGLTFPVFSTSSGTLEPPIGGIVGRRSRFLETIVPVDEIDLVQTWSSQTSGPLFSTVQIDSVHAGGTIALLYNYTAPVPEPRTCALLVAGLGLLGFAARRRSVT